LTFRTVPERSVTAFFCFLALLFLRSETALAQKYKFDDPVPSTASGKVLPIKGKVTGIKGLGLGVAGKAEAVGAALKELGAKSTETEIRIELSSDILFDFDRAELRPQAVPHLEKVATILRSYPNSSSTIEGHTDNKGTRQYNQKLSVRRADSVKNWLLAQGVASPMTTRGSAETKPVAPNSLPDGKDNPEGRQKNRRVEIIILKR
jgi:outer membrane protein OmpA-like peptidoglycan-associated protein